MLHRNDTKFCVKVPYNFGLKVYRPEEYNWQMHELTFRVDVLSRCKRNERAKRAYSLYIKTSIKNNYKKLKRK